MTRRDMLRRGTTALGALGACAAFLNVPTAFAAQSSQRLLTQPRLAQTPTPGLQPEKVVNPLGLALGTGTSNFDMNSVRAAVIGILGAAAAPIPGLSPLVAALVGLLWPAQGPDVWDQIKDQVEALVDQKISAYNVTQVTEDLQGLKSVFQNYAAALSDKNPDDIRTYFIDARTAIEQAEPHFVDQADAVPLLPLMAQMANLHLGLLREGVINGKSWGMNDAEVSDLHNGLATWIQTYVSHSQSVYQQGLSNVPKVPGFTNEIALFVDWIARNAYIRGMTLSVLDYAFYWPSFDPATNPNGNLPKLTREIYSDPRGGFGDPSSLANLAPPSARITDLKLWASAAGVHATQVAYGGGWGAVLGTPKSSDSTNPPYGWSGSIKPTNPIVQVNGYTYTGIVSMTFLLKDGSSLGPFGFPGDPNTFYNRFGKTAPTFQCSYPDEVLSSVRMISTGTDQLDNGLAVFGFSFDDESPRADLAGARVRQDGTQEIYLIDDNGTKRHIPDQPTYNNLFTDYNGIQQRTDVIGITLGPGITSGAYLARAVDAAGQPIYLVDNGQRRHIASPAAFNKFYFSWSNVRNVAMSTLDIIPAGPEII